MPQQDSPVAVVSTTGAVLDRSAVEALAAEVRQRRAHGVTHIVVEASSLQTADYAGLAAMLTWAADERQASGAPVALAELSRPLLLAACQVRLQREVDVYASRDAALRHLGGS